MNIPNPLALPTVLAKLAFCAVMYAQCSIRERYWMYRLAKIQRARLNLMRDTEES